ncbi:hypothetical protein PHYSODRAFT_326786 [Phytophthora sojae]|uniref:Uncharacterized protein n=1 Tax=Phytophthora sojae (strain P6497) TaxID=1094619 RepID=G4YZP2_PHYSP|nr:hypothetical protein PHYSODRAFT_326786 [Phytophthora sojae]EGZ25810.1 hypothetical protein PHYSODRAFT_326786 [Phytophthora sojae]|eukprot:XP_009521098.1 hypothetical protein PHYSODRAFT_326786 [Phytophthora sojae]
MADDGYRSTGAGNVPAPTEADAGTTYAEDHERWALYDYSGLRAPLADEDMQSLFHRCGSQQAGHGDTRDDAVTGCCGPAVFIRGLEPREEQHRARSVSALAKQSVMGTIARDLTNLRGGVF